MQTDKSPLDFEAWEESEADEIHCAFYETGANYECFSDRDYELWLERRYNLYLSKFKETETRENRNAEQI